MTLINAGHFQMTVLITANISPLPKQGNCGPAMSPASYRGDALFKKIKYFVPELSKKYNIACKG